MAEGPLFPFVKKCGHYGELGAGWAADMLKAHMSGTGTSDAQAKEEEGSYGR